jgi:anti-anti-sigma factor
MEISVWHEQARVPVAVLRLKGPVTEAGPIQAKADELFAAGARKIVVDLSEVPYMASAGLRALHHIYTLLRTDAAEERDVAVGRLNPNPRVLEVLHTTGYDMFLEIHRHLQQALDSY